MEIKISNIENVLFATYGDFVFCDRKKNGAICHSGGILHHTQQMVYRAAFRKKTTDSASKTTTFLNQSCFLDFSIIIVYVASSTVMTPSSFSQTTQCNSHSVQKAALRSILHVSTEQTKKFAQTFQHPGDLE